MLHGSGAGGGATKFGFVGGVWVLAANKEVAIALNLISGRYYPGLMEHPCIAPFFPDMSEPYDPDSKHHITLAHLVAMDGFNPTYRAHSPFIFSGTLAADVKQEPPTSIALSRLETLDGA